MSEGWGYQKSCIHFDEVSGEFSVGGTPILKASVCEFQLNLEWLDRAWGQWEELGKDPEYLALKKLAESKLEAGRKRLDKGKGKGGASA